MKLQVVLIILYDKKRRFLLQHRSGDASLMPNAWAFFGGSLDPGETPVQAVFRETQEELDYQLKSPCLVLEQEFQEANAHGYMYVFIEPFNEDKSILKLQEGQGWGWYTRDEMRQLNMIQRDTEIIEAVVNYLEEKSAVALK